MTSVESTPSTPVKNAKKPRVSRSTRAGLVFPVARVGNALKNTREASRVTEGASIFLAATLEYLTAEILELAGNAAHDRKRKIVRPDDIKMAVRNDSELDVLLKEVTFASAGSNLPFIHSAVMHGLKPATAKPKTTSKPVGVTKKTNKTTAAPKPKPKKTASAASRYSYSAPDVDAGDNDTDTEDNTALWQYFDGNWRNYDKKAAATVEQAYQDYMRNPAMCDVRAVKSGKWQYMVDFLNWRQTNVEHHAHTVRNIRRVGSTPTTSASTSAEVTTHLTTLNLSTATAEPESTTSSSSSTTIEAPILPAPSPVVAESTHDPMAVEIPVV